MRLAWVTDIHLNFLSDDRVKAFAETIARERPDALAITGDIAEAPTLGAYLLTLERFLRVPIYFVLGNHDFYRGDIRSVRAQMVELSRAHPSVQWMPARGLVALGATHGMVGHDGWGDARIGNAGGSEIELSDWVYIRELTGLHREKRIKRLRELGDQAAEQLRPQLFDALERFSSVIVLTHVPPFRESCWHEGQISGDDWLPWFTCKSVGDLLLEATGKYPEARITVLCGHTHGEGTAKIRANLEVFTGAAAYGRPVVAGVFELDVSGVRGIGS